MQRIIHGLNCSKYIWSPLIEPRICDSIEHGKEMEFIDALGFLCDLTCSQVGRVLNLCSSSPSGFRCWKRCSLETLDMCPDIIRRIEALLEVFDDCASYRGRYVVLGEKTPKDTDMKIKSSLDRK
jgi:hypothetical protein